MTTDCAETGIHFVRHSLRTLPHETSPEYVAQTRQDITNFYGDGRSIHLDDTDILCETWEGYNYTYAAETMKLLANRTTLESIEWYFGLPAGRSFWEWRILPEHGLVGNMHWRPKRYRDCSTFECLVGHELDLSRRVVGTRII